MDQQRGQAEPEQAAFELLYRRHMPGIMAYVNRRVSAREDMEDLLVEVFQAALENLGKLVQIEDTAQQAWLRRVAHNKLVDFYRRTQRRPITSLEEHAEMLYEDDERTPEQITLRKEEYASLGAHLTQLSEQQREVIHLHFAAGLRCAEIARLLNKSEGAVRMLLARALNNLRATYAQQREEQQL